MPDSDESCRIIRPASHTSALGLVFIAENGAGAQGGSCRGVVAGCRCGKKGQWMKAHESNLHAAYRSTQQRRGPGAHIRMTSILEAVKAQQHSRLSH